MERPIRLEEQELRRSDLFIKMSQVMDNHRNRVDTPILHNAITYLTDPERGKATLAQLDFDRLTMRSAELGGQSCVFNYTAFVALDGTLACDTIRFAPRSSRANEDRRAVATSMTGLLGGTDDPLRRAGADLSGRVTAQQISGDIMVLREAGLRPEGHVAAFERVWRERARTGVDTRTPVEMAGTGSDKEAGNMLSADIMRAHGSNISGYFISVERGFFNNVELSDASIGAAQGDELVFFMSSFQNVEIGTSTRMSLGDIMNGDIGKEDARPRPKIRFVHSCARLGQPIQVRGPVDIEFDPPLGRLELKPELGFERWLHLPTCGSTSEDGTDKSTLAAEAEAKTRMTTIAGTGAVPTTLSPDGDAETKP